MNVLIVEDEVRLGEALAQIMREQKYNADVVNDGEDGLSYALCEQYDVIVLDVMLPKRDGFSVAREVRRAGIATPILMLTARDEITDKVSGLDCGADDYMTKSFSTVELLARVRALSRRKGEVMLDKITLYDITLDLSAYDLSCGEKSVHLGFKEFEIMRLLMSNSHAYTSKDELISRVWGMLSDAEDNNVEAYISFLRKKLFFIGSKVTIETQRKVGYRLEAKDND